MPNSNANAVIVKWTPRQVFLATLFVAGLLLSLALLYHFRIVVLMLFVAILIGTGLKPGVSFLAARGIPRLRGQILIYVALLVGIGGFAVFALPPFVEQSSAVTTLARSYYNDLRRVLVFSDSTIVRNLALTLAPNLDLDLTDESEETVGTPQEEAAETANAVAQVFTYIGVAAQVIFFVVATSLMAFYWTLESDRAIRTVLLLFAPSRRDDAREVIGAVEQKLGAYLFGMGILLLAIGILSLIAYLLIGLPNALVLAVIAGLMEAVPTIGPILGAIPAVLVAASTDPSKIIWVVAASIVIQLAENNLLVPRVMDRSVGVSPLLTILAIAALSSLIGLAGALLAVPIAAIVQLLFNRFIVTPVLEPALKPEGRSYGSYLRLQAQEIAHDSRSQIAMGAPDVAENPDDERIEELIESLARDLDQILAQVAQAGEAPEVGT